jgi:thymidylate synthase
MSRSLRFDDIYVTLLNWLLHTSPEQTNDRTGHKVRVGRGGTSFRLDLSDRVLPTAGVRKLFPKSAAAEVAWYLSGSQDVTWIRKYAPLWDKFVEADGKTIESAYGYRWRKHFGRDQIERAIEALRTDPSDRRVFISAWDPAQDGLGELGQRNVPCPVSFNFYVLQGELHSTMTKRSTDVFVGLPYDVMGHALLMAAMAETLAVKLGVMQVSLSHPHLYEDHYEMAQQCIDLPYDQRVMPAIPLPRVTVRDIEQHPDAYVQVMAEAANTSSWPLFNPKPFVVE